MTIKQLPISIANQIAAGEVIERPASVVKELLENACDAKADVVTIDIGYGGLNQIKISDNGEGICAQDLALAIAPHATSKISKLDDLYAINTLGFRGEALASIASIARITITSKPQDQKNAMCFTFDGNFSQILPCARIKGTTIEVSDLFYNAPVRKKFLKSEQSEYQAIELLVKRFALSAPTIAIMLNHNGKLQLQVNAANCEQSRLMRIRKILGKNFIEHAHYLNVGYGNMHLYGWLADAEYLRSQNDQQLIYVNGRMVKDKLLNHAIKQAYEKILYPGRYPACLLYLVINPMEVDVNVHPTKHELRFHQPRLVHDFLRSQIQRALDTVSASKEVVFGQPDALRPISVNEQPVQTLNNPVNLYPQDDFTVTDQLFNSQLRKWHNEVNFAKEAKISLKQRDSNLLTKHATGSALFELSEKLSTKSRQWVSLNAGYALVMVDSNPYLVAVVPLQQQWLSSLLAHKALPLTSRPILVPVHFAISAFPTLRAETHRQQLLAVGIQFEQINNDTIVIHSIPIDLPYFNIADFLNLVFKEAVAIDTAALIKLLVCCQTFHNNLTQEEKEILLDYLNSVDDSQSNMSSCCRFISADLCKELLVCA